MRPRQAPTPRACLAALLAVVGCTTTPAPKEVVSGGVASAILVPMTGPGEPITQLAPLGDAAQVELVVMGAPEPVTDLIAELASTTNPDGATRWAVDTPRPGSPGAIGRILVPRYAVAPGDHVLTLWRGDAEVRARFRFRVP